jgi:hypothetical protein
MPDALDSRSAIHRRISKDLRNAEKFGDRDNVSIGRDYPVFIGAAGERCRRRLIPVLLHRARSHAKKLSVFA